MLIWQGRIFMYIENIVRLITGSMATLLARAFAPHHIIALSAKGLEHQAWDAARAYRQKCAIADIGVDMGGIARERIGIAGTVAAAIGRGPIASMQRRRVASRLGRSG